MLLLSKPSELVLAHATGKRTSCCNCLNLKCCGSREKRIRDANALSTRKAATAGLIDSQRWLRAARWLVIQEPNWPRSIRPWHSRKVPGIGSEAIGAGTGIGVAFDALPQLAAEAEGSGGAKGRQGTGGSVWGGPSPCEGPDAIGFQAFRLQAYRNNGRSGGKFNGILPQVTACCVARRKTKFGTPGTQGGM